tara:strand:- start:2140 stop:4026 length:1887 start_codon:yes stop_codon:yes gene_type:complete
MSLVVTSNISKDEDMRPDTSNTFKPYSYQNRLLNTMKIPPMSEIALESCKITKNGLLSISAENSAFSAFFGPTPGTDLESSTTQPTFGISGGADSFSGGGRVERNPTDFARDITTGLGNAVYHPALVTGVGTSGVKVTVEKDTATNDFKGFRWTSTQNVAVTNKTAAFTYKDVSHNESSSVTISGIGNEILTSSSADGFYVQNRQQSISQNNGEVVIDFENCLDTGQRFMCGLSRINTDKGWAGGFIPDSYEVGFGSGQPFRGGVGGDNGMFFDICIGRVGNTLRVFQAQTTTTGTAVTNGRRQRDALVMREITYYGAAFGVAPFNKDDTPLDITDSDYTKVKFTLTNEHVRIDLWDDDKSAYQLLIDNIATKAAGGSKKNLTLPRTASQWNMYPTMAARSVGAALKLEGVAHYTAQPVYDPATYTSYNWWGHLEAGGLTRWASEIDVRPWNDFSSAVELVPKLLGGGKSMADYLFSIVMMPSDLYGRQITQGLNTAQIYGFENQSVAFPIPANVVDAVQFFVSNNVPDIVSTSSLFVRLNNFTQESINARQGTVSKIIAHLPRFDNAGNETGGLFFQPGEKTYVALNNPDTIYINSFDVDYVYDNETLCKAITGKSITVFHIRRSMV